METHFLINGLGRARQVTRNGKDYLVAPATIIVPGVLPGSKGALYYPPEECAANVSAWDKIPLTVYHPSDPLTNRPLRARTEDGKWSRSVWEQQGIGFTEQSTYNGKLRTQTWFDVERTRAADKRLGTDILSRLQAGQPIELSTGLDTTNRQAPPSSSHLGKPYTHTAHDYRPDHLAILPDQVGACSLRDGCGVLVNANPEGCNQYKGCEAGSARDEKTIKREIAEHKKDMKERGIKISSFMNRHPSMEAAKANEKLFALKTELEGASKKGSEAGSPKHIKDFLAKHDVTPESFSGFGPQTRSAITDKYNEQHRTKISKEDFHSLVTNQKVPMLVTTLNLEELELGESFTKVINERGEVAWRVVTNAAELPRHPKEGKFQGLTATAAAKGHGTLHTGGKAGTSIDRLTPDKPGVEADEADDHTAAAIEEGADDIEKRGADQDSDRSPQSVMKTTTNAENCGGEMYTSDSGSNPHDVSKRAAGASVAAEHSGARGNALAALDKSKEGDSGKAADLHGKAALAHEAQATAERKKGNGFGAEQHDNAAALHRKAASMHTAGATENANPEGINQYTGGGGRVVTDAKEKVGGKHAILVHTNDNKVNIHLHDDADSAGLMHGALHSASNVKGIGRAKLPAGMTAGKLKEASSAQYGKKGVRAEDIKIVHNQRGEAMTKQQKLAALTANCKCDEDRAALNSLSEETINGLYSAKALTTNAKAEGSNADAKGSGSDQAGGEETTDDHDYDSDEGQGLKGKGKGKAMSTNEWMANAPAEVRSAVRNAMEIEKRERLNLVQHLVANVNPEEKRKLLFNRLKGKSLEELRELSALVPTRNERRYNSPRDLQYDDLQTVNYLGAAGGSDQVVNRNDNDPDDILPLPTMNYSEIAAEQRAEAAGKRREQA